MVKKEVAKPGMMSNGFLVLQHVLKHACSPPKNLPSIYGGGKIGIAGSSTEEGHLSESLGKMHIDSSASGAGSSQGPQGSQGSQSSQGSQIWSPQKLEQHRIQMASGGWVDWGKDNALSPSEWQQWQWQNGQWVDYTPEQNTRYRQKKRYEAKKATGWQDWLLPIPEEDDDL